MDAPGLIAIPGFVQTHIHLCQTLFRGLAEDVELLDWLQRRIFPFEAAHSPSSMYASARIGLAELIRSGTTTIMDMGSVHHEEEVVRAVTRIRHPRLPREGAHGHQRDCIRRSGRAPKMR